MENVKPWQIILIVLAMGGLAFSIWKFMPSNNVPTTQGYMTVDIMTGQLYDIRKGKAKGVPLPAKHPDTGVRTLYPVTEVSGSTWEIPEGFSSFITDEIRKQSKLNDGQMTISVLPEEAIVFKLR